MTPAYMTPVLLTQQDIQTLIQYLDRDDDRTDSRPDVRSKHPRWDQDDWPQHVIQRAMDRIASPGYVIEEVTFQDTQIALKPHTDNVDPPGRRGKTVMFLLSADPVAHTIFFHQRMPQHNPATGAFFRRTPWTRFGYRLIDRSGTPVWVTDIRELLSACREDPGSVEDFDVTPEFTALLADLVHKRSLPQLSSNEKTRDTGFIQPAPRLNDYSLLTPYDPTARFDARFRDLYLRENDLEDLHGLTVESVLTWQAGSAIVFDREQLHSSSNCHGRKRFITLFCHETNEAWLDHGRG